MSGLQWCDQVLGHTHSTHGVALTALHETAYVVQGFGAALVAPMSRHGSLPSHQCHMVGLALTAKPVQYPARPVTSLLLTRSLPWAWLCGLVLGGQPGI
jgi:hypothetical protein